MLHAEYRLLQAEKARLKTEAEALRLAEQLHRKLDEIERVKKAILEGVETSEI